jgi:hypothetical protein
VLRKHGFVVHQDPTDVICGLDPPADDMPVSLTNADDEEAYLGCGLRRGPIWGPELTSDLDAPPASPVFSGRKAEFKVANLECTIYPEGPRTEAQIGNLQRAMEKLAQRARWLASIRGRSGSR